MTQTTKRKTPTTLEDIPVVPTSKLRAKLRRRISTCERRYEMSTEKMREVVRKDPLRETLEICDWLMADLVAKGSSRDGEKHGWLILDRYVAIHRGALERHPFVLADRTEVDQPASAPGLLSLRGQVICAAEVVIEIEKYLTVRLNNRNQIEARGRRYRYHAHIPGRGNLLRYDNSHGLRRVPPARVRLPNRGPETA